MSSKVQDVVMLGDSLTQSGGITTLQNLIIKYAAPDLNIDHIATRDEGLIVYRFIVFVRAIWLLIWRLMFKKTDLIHIHISDGGSIFRKAIIAIIAFLFHKPVLMHTNGFKFHLDYDNSPKFVQQIMQWVFSRCNGWIAVTNIWQDFYTSSLGLDPQKVFILFNPTEIPPEIPNRVNSPNIKIAFLGRIGDRKGTFDLIHAFAKLPENFKNSTQLLVAGSGEIDRARQLTESLSVTKQITFLGLIDSQARNLLLEQVDIYVLPTYNEGLPLALLEAMSWGLPVITTPVSGIPEIVNDTENGLLVNPGEIQQLTDAMKLLIENEDLRLSLGKAARKTAEELVDVKKFSNRLAEIYQKVTENN
jgi:glycosyltransferase involved in cell wall biosynthesis